MRKRIFAFMALAVLVTGSAWTHHNMAAMFDLNQRFTEAGTLTKLDWRNPHIYLSVDVKSEEGEIETWQFEGPSPVSIRERFAVGKSDFESSLGKTVTVEASRARDGSLLGLLRQITLADGSVVSLCAPLC